MDKITVEFTKEEIYTLQAAFEVLVKGSGTYTMLHLPQIVETHRQLFQKFTKAMKVVDKQ